MTLVGKIDRIDRLADGSALVIDYKTEAPAATAKRIKESLEDTQLAFYAALLTDDTLAAAYVNVGEKDAAKPYVQPDVVGLRDQLLEGIASDMARIAAGAALPALGEGKACDYCAARGLMPQRFLGDDAHDVPCHRMLAAPAKVVQRSFRPCWRSRIHPECNGRLRTQRPAGQCRSLLRHRLRPAPQRGGGSLRRCRQNLDAGVAHRARAAGWRGRPERAVAGAAARDSGHHLHQTGGQRDAGAAVPMAGGLCAAADHETLVKELRDRGVLIKNDLQPPSMLPEQLSNLYQSILASGRQVQVRTFHSWFAALLRSAPLAVLQQMELPANYELLEDDAPAKALVWRRFYAALVADAERQRL